MHKAFFPLFLTALVGIVLSSFFHQSSGFLQWIGLIAGLLPLMIYHTTLIKARLLSSTEIDSIYYFGFLVTIITLVTTAISIGVADKKEELNLQWVLLQFALGLIATGYALFARLHLLAISTTSIEADMVSSTEKLAKNIEKIAKEFDNAGFQVQAFVERTEKRLTILEEETVTRMDAVVTSFDQRLSASQVAFQDSLNKSVELTLEKTARTMASTTQQFSNSISSVMEEIIRIQSEAEGISFTLASQRILEFSTDMTGSIQSITTSVHDSAKASSDAVLELSATFKKSAKLAADISKKLSDLDGVIALITSINDATEAMANFSQSTTEAESAISSLSIKTSQAEEALREQFTIPFESVKLGLALSEFESSFRMASTTFNSNLSSLSKLFPSIETEASTLSLKMSSVANSISQMGDAMSNSPTELNAAIQHLKTQIASVSTSIEIALPQLNTAIASVAEQLKSFDLGRTIIDFDKKSNANTSI
jgi:predicted  nucleic acid-binding Zn-ribbon protein